MTLKKDDAELHLTQQKDHRPAKFNVAHMLVSNIEAVYRLCHASRLRIIKPIQDKDYGLKAVVFADRWQPTASTLAKRSAGSSE